MEQINDACVLEILNHCGPGQFMFVGLVDKRMCCIYSKHHTKETSTRNTITSVSRLQSALYEPNYTISPKLLGQHASIDVIACALTNNCKLLTSSLCEGLAFSGRFQLVHELHTTLQCPLSPQVAVAFAYKGDLPGVQYVLSQDCGWTLSDKEDVFVTAAEQGHKHILEWGYSNGYPWVVLYPAAVAGHTALIKTIITSPDFDHHEIPFLSASADGNYRAFKCYHDVLCGDSCTCGRRFEKHEFEIGRALAVGASVEMWQWFKAHTDDDVMSEIMEWGLQDAVQSEDFVQAEWLLSQGAVWLPFSSDCGIVCLSLNAMSWALTHQCPWGDWDSDCCTSLLDEGRGDIVQWAHTSNCPCTCNTI